MRIWHRLKNLMLLLLATTVALDAAAQNMPGYPPYGAPAGMAGPPPGYAPGAGMPQSYQAHPTISPFENTFEQHVNSDGMWFKRAIGGMTNPNDFYFNIDYTRTKSRTLRGIFGDATAPTFDQEGILANTITTRNSNVTFPDALTLPTFARHDIGLLLANENQGIRLSGGLKNQTGWRFAWNVAYNGSSTNTFDARANLRRPHSQDLLLLQAGGFSGNGALPTNLHGVDERSVVFDQILGARLFDNADADDYSILGTTSEILDRQLYPLGGIGIQTGEAVGPGILDSFGTNQLFDLEFILKHEVQSYGTGFHFSASPLYEKGNLQVRPIVGGRFFRLQEGIGFFGADSGLDYDVNTPDGVDNDNDGLIDNVAENGTLNFVNLVTDTSRQILVRSFLNSNVRSSMAGPEAGIEYEVAKKKDVTFSGSTRVGALVNTEKMDLAGDNIGNALSNAVDVSDPAGQVIQDQLFDTSTLSGQLTANAFTDTATSTHISPMFEQSLMAELPLFSRIPVLRDVWQLEHARLRLGWTYTWIGEVADPNGSIVWQSNPIDGRFLQLKTQRTDYWQNQFNLGLNWEF